MNKPNDTGFTEFEQQCFEFLQDPHPAELVMIKTIRAGKEVSLLCFEDGEVLRPLAQMLTDEDLKEYTDLQKV